MARMDGITVTGIKPFRKKMKRLPEKVRKRVVKKAVPRAGAYPGRYQGRDRRLGQQVVDQSLFDGHFFCNSFVISR